MKNKFIPLLIYIFFSANAFAENISIQAKNITLDKDKITSVFENNVTVKTKEKVIKSDYAKYNKKLGLIIIKDNIIATDNFNNIIQTEYAEYNENKKILLSKGLTKIITPKGYKLEGEDITLNNDEKRIFSNKNSILKDLEGNEIFLENFEYSSENNIFKSIGLAKLKDIENNSYEFSQIYIDTDTKEILGTDIKAFLNHEDFKINKKNNPRIFANSAEVSKTKSIFNKSIFTICQYRENDKCPPWSIQSRKMLHDNKKKTIYYDHAVVKVYNIPIFYFPKFSHPDPTVDRRSGFLPPTLYDSKNLGAGISIPYFFNLGIDKNFTLTNRIYNSENPLIMGEYHQAFANSNFLADFGYTAGYKKTSTTKKAGDKSHFFSKIIKNFSGKKGSENTLSFTTQNVSNDKYLKLYKIKSNLVDYSRDTLENSLDFTHSDDDVFFGLNASVYETLKDSYEDKYEYILPEITLAKNLISDQVLGNVDFQSNYKAHAYETNKFTNFLINDFDWTSRNIFSSYGINTKFLGNIKNINYEAKNEELYKDEITSELFGALGSLSTLKLEKIGSNSNHFLTPKILVRYAPGSMRKETSGMKLDPISAFSLDRISNLNNYETGLSTTLGFDYNLKNNDKETKFDFSLAQIINDKENKQMADKTSLNEKLSDLVGSANYNLTENFKINYNFSIDQNYQDFNYNEIGAKYDYGLINFDFNYLSENNHIGDQNYFKSKINLKNKDKGIASFETKRNLITNSSEFYNLSYEYINDCLRAGLVYRREFYNDSEIEPENSLMFKITLSPFGNLNSPKIDR